MHIGHYVFYQITNRFKRQFNRIVSRHNDRTKDWSFTLWNHLCVLIFAQLSGYASLRELADVIQAHAKRSYNLGFGATTPNRSVISKSNILRDYRIYEDFAFYMVGQAQKRRITKEFELGDRTVTKRTGRCCEYLVSLPNMYIVCGAGKCLLMILQKV